MGLPCSSAGITGRGGARRRLPMSPTSSGASAMKSRRKREDEGRLLHRPHHHARQHRRPEGLELEREVGDDAEVAAAAPQPPEQVGVLVLVGHHELAVGGDHVAGAEGVDGEAELAHEVADAAAQGQAADAGVADEAAGGGQPEGLGLPVEMGVEAAALDLDRPGLGVDPRSGHCRQVDHQPVVAHGVAGDGVPAAPDGRVEALVAAEADGGDDVGHARAAGDQRRPALDVAVPDLADLVVVGGVGRHQPPLEVGGQAFDRRSTDALGVHSSHQDLLPSPPMCRSVVLASTKSVLVQKCERFYGRACPPTVSSAPWPWRRRCSPSAGRRSSSASCCAGAPGSTTCGGGCPSCRRRCCRSG